MRNRNPYLSWWKRLEKLLVRSVILGAVLLVVTQSFLATDPLRHVVGYVDLKDIKESPNAGQQLVPGKPTVTFYLKEYAGLPKLQVLINGESVGKFNDRYVTVQVQEGDLIELDATFYNNPAQIEVLETSAQVVYPKQGQTLKATGITSLGKVTIQNSR